MQIKPATLDRGIKQLKGIIHLYRQTTDMLISDFIADSNDTAQSTDASCGEVSMEIDAYHHPATGELEGTIRGMYMWCTSMMCFPNHLAIHVVVAVPNRAS